MQKAPLIATSEQLGLAMNDLSNAVHLSRRFPASPFTSPGIYSFCEYESFTSLTFGRSIASLAALYGDEWISGIVLDPAPDTYFDEDGVFGAFRYAATENASHWATAIQFAPGGNAAATIQVQSMVFAAVGSTGRWSVWGERSEGLAVVRTDGDDFSWQGQEGPFVDRYEALRSFVEPNYTRSPLPAEFVNKFHSSFESLPESNN